MFIDLLLNRVMTIVSFLIILNLIFVLVVVTNIYSQDTSNDPMEFSVFVSK